MAKTRHIQKRMKQRCIDEQVLQMVREFGCFDNGDKLILNKKGIKAALDTLCNYIKTLKKIEKKGGVVLVSMGDTEITTYDLDSYKNYH